VANLAFVVTGSLAIIVAIFAEPIVNAELGIAPGSFHLISSYLFYETAI
jgi:hypothetical protein